MKEVLCVGYVNGIDFLRDSLACYQPYFSDIRIINNSLLPIDIPDYENVTIVNVPVSLTTAQTVNWARHIAIEEGFDVLWLPHHDMTITDEKILDTKEQVEDIFESGKKWGVVFTLYDVFCAFNVEALIDVGGWDALRFFYYTGDVDFYGRLQQNGWKAIDVGGDGVWHYASGVIAVDSERNFVVQKISDIGRELYLEKWKDNEFMRNKLSP